MARREGAIEGHPRAGDRRGLKLNSPLVVQWEYASEERQAKRDATYRRLVEGDHAEDVAFDAVAKLTARSPARVLDAGCGTGEFAERVQRELGAAVCAIDLSARMVELTAQRGVEAEVADIQALPFADGTFDVVVANWVLYHVEDLDRGLAELARVLRPGGALVAGTQGRGHLLNVWRLLGDPWQPELSFDDVNGLEALRRHFASVEVRRGDGVMAFADASALRDYVAVTITHAHLSARVPETLGAFGAEVRHAVFVAEKAA
jgi:SAM-dependent methyltransferase